MKAVLFYTLQEVHKEIISHSTTFLNPPKIVNKPAAISIKRDVFLKQEDL